MTSRVCGRELLSARSPIGWSHPPFATKRPWLPPNVGPYEE
jgi:hypothetical protein